MENFIKYYSYNQVIEEHDVLIMTQQEYSTNKNKLDNPKMIVCVNRQGGIKEPKIPKWFQAYKKENDAKFEQINAKFERIDAKFEQMDNEMPKWFKTWYDNFEHRLNEHFDKIESRLDNIVRLNNLKE